MIADGIRNGLPFHDKDLLYLAERLNKEGTSFIQVTLPLLGRALDHSLVTGRFTLPANFAMKRNTRLPRFLYQLFERVLDQEGNLREEPCTLTIYFLRQLLLFDAKLITEPTSQQKQTAVKGFIKRQNDLRKIRLDVNDPVLLRAQWLLGRVLRTLDLSTIAPGHGPGVVAERLTREERWDFTSWPKKAERYYPYLVYGTLSMRASLERGIGVRLLNEMSTRCCLVPKDFRGPRLISAEPTVNQYLQQGQMRKIMQYVDHHKVLSQSIRLRDQTHNQKEAKNAYKDGKITLDLSDASDTVSTALVWFLFAKLPLLRRQLMSTRSDFMEFENQKIRIVAFSPMGSATCFPIESLVFWALTIASLGHVRSLSGHPDGLESLSVDVSIFGDDIIVPADAASTLLYTLRKVGCSPNMSKTCMETPFRESCGTEWFNGSDITIIRNRRYHYADKGKFSDHPVLLGLQRKFFLCGLYSTAKLCERWAKEIYPVLTIPISKYPLLIHRGSSTRASSDALERDLLRGSRGSFRCKLISERFQRSLCDDPSDIQIDPYFARDSFAVDSYNVSLGWDFDHCVNLPIRWNRDYQRLEFRAPRVFQSSSCWKSDGYARLFARLSSDLTERFVHRDRKIKMAWSNFPMYISLSDIKHREC
jgi:hypothetical protein